MAFSGQTWTDLMVIVGEITVLFLVILFLFSLFVVIVIALSLRNKRYYFPKPVKAGIVLTQGLVKAICGLFGIDDKELALFFIRLQNSMNSSVFAKIPVEKRALFLPQCLRSAECPANLTPEGLICKRCGRCDIGKHIDTLEAMGYHVWICPGSTLIKRMVKDHHPEALIGVGCLIEVKDGLELSDHLGIPAMGVITLKDGCVETLLNWNDLFEVAVLGTEYEGNVNLSLAP